jgi:hypothetical protein
MQPITLSAPASTNPGRSDFGSSLVYYYCSYLIFGSAKELLNRKCMVGWILESAGARGITLRRPGDVACRRRINPSFSEDHLSH